jgi:hypothetical protein
MHLLLLNIIFKSVFIWWKKKVIKLKEYLIYCVNELNEMCI